MAVSDEKTMRVPSSLIARPYVIASAGVFVANTVAEPPVRGCFSRSRAALGVVP